jgi:hypothetical protein
MQLNQCVVIINSQIINNNNNNNENGLISSDIYRHFAVLQYRESAVDDVNHPNPAFRDGNEEPAVAIASRIATVVASTGEAPLRRRPDCSRAAASRSRVVVHPQAIERLHDQMLASHANVSVAVAEPCGMTRRQQGKDPVQLEVRAQTTGKALLAALPVQRHGAALSWQLWATRWHPQRRGGMMHASCPDTVARGA